MTDLWEFAKKHPIWFSIIGAVFVYLVPKLAEAQRELYRNTFKDWRNDVKLFSKMVREQE